MVGSTQVDLTTVCATFPDLDETTLIDRPHILSTIDSFLADNGGIRTMVLEGSEGIGKSTLALQYARRHRFSAISTFISGSSKWGYDPDFIKQDLSTQIYWYLKGEAPEKDLLDSEEFFGNLIFDLRRRLRQQSARLTFVIDGLSEIPVTDPAARQAIMSCFPFDFDRCRFVFTADSTKSLSLPATVLPKDFLLSGFSLDEAIRFLGHPDLARSLCEELLRSSQGLPGRLASVRRQLIGADSLDEIQKRILVIHEDAYASEWKQVAANEVALKALAVVTFGDSEYIASQIARILRVSPDSVVASLSHLTFLSSADQTQVVRFVSDSYRQYARKRLQHFLKDINNLIIDDMLSQPEAEATMSLLPAKLNDAGRYKELLELVSPEHVAKLMIRDRSVGPARRYVEFGVEAATKLGRDGDLLRLSLQKAALADSYAVNVCRAEINARVASGEYAAALGLATSVTIREDRLHLLACVARAKRLEGLAPDLDLLEQIKSTAAQLDDSVLENGLESVASDLLFAAPDLALSLIDRSVKARAKRSSSSPFSALSRASEDATSTELDVEKRAMREAESRDAAILTFSTATSLLLGGFSAAEIVREVDSFKKVEDQLYFLRRWVVRNRRRDDAHTVITHALGVILRATAYKPTARDFRQLAMAVPFVADTETRTDLIRSFDAQRSVIESAGPSVEVLRLNVLLAEADGLESYRAMANRLVESYLHILQTVSDVPTRSECLGHLISALTRMSDKDQLESEESLHSLATSELDRCVVSLIDGTAEQFAALKGTIEALAVALPDLADSLAAKLNTEYRRDRARLSLINAAVSSRRGIPSASLLLNVYRRIVSPVTRSDAATALWRRVDDRSVDDGVTISNLMPFVATLSDIRDPFLKCQALVSALKLCHGDTSKDWSGLREQLRRQISDAWASIDSAWEKISSAFEIAAMLAKIERTFSAEYMQLASDERDVVLKGNLGCSKDYLSSAAMSVSAYGGLIRWGIDVDQDLADVRSVISRIPSTEKAVQIWADICERLVLSGKADRCKQLVEEQLGPLLGRLKNKNCVWDDLIVAAGPALHNASSDLFREDLASLPSDIRDEAIVRVCHFILSRSSTFEPNQVRRGHEFDLSYSDAVTVLKLAEQATEDAAVYSLVEKVSDSVMAKRNQVRISIEQRNDIAKRIEDLATNHFPCPRFIRHDGYKVLSESQVARIKKSTGKIWDDIVDRARRIPNLSDRAYVLALTLRNVPNKDLDRCKTAIADAHAALELVPSMEDRIERYRSIGQALWDIDSKVAK